MQRPAVVLHRIDFSVGIVVIFAYDVDRNALVHVIERISVGRYYYNVFGNKFAGDPAAVGIIRHFRVAAVVNVVYTNKVGIVPAVHADAQPAVPQAVAVNINVVVAGRAFGKGHSPCPAGAPVKHPQVGGAYAVFIIDPDRSELAANSVEFELDVSTIRDRHAGCLQKFVVKADDRAVYRVVEHAGTIFVLAQYCSRYEIRADDRRSQRIYFPAKIFV